MTKIILISDTHGDLAPLVEMVDREQDAAAFFHAGDGYKELEQLKKLYPHRKIYGVVGNCDWDTKGPVRRLVTVEGLSILLTHGHLEGVKTSLNRLGEEGRSQGADLVLYGHTHQGKVTQVHQMQLINGGYGSPLLGQKASYCRIECTDNQVIVTFVKWGGAYE